MALRLNMQQGQRLTMTPLLQQAIQLLQLSTLELEQVVRKELEENPLLEELPEEKQEVDGEAAPATDALAPCQRRLSCVPGRGRSIGRSPRRGAGSLHPARPRDRAARQRRIP